MLPADYEGPSDSDTDTPSDSEKEEEEEDLQVEAILSHQGDGAARMYLVKWEGYADQTWEPPQSFGVEHVLLAAYLEALKG